MRILCLVLFLYYRISLGLGSKILWQQRNQEFINLVILRYFFFFKEDNYYFLLRELEKILKMKKYVNILFQTRQCCVGWVATLQFLKLIKDYFLFQSIDERENKLRSNND